MIQCFMCWHQLFNMTADLCLTTTRHTRFLKALQYIVPARSEPAGETFGSTIDINNTISPGASEYNDAAAYQTKSTAIDNTTGLVPLNHRMFRDRALVCIRLHVTPNTL